MKTKSLKVMASIIGCLMLTSCAQQIGQATFLSSNTVNFTYQAGAKYSVPVQGGGGSIDDAVKNALYKAGNNYDALIDVKIVRTEVYCILFEIIGYKVYGTPVNTSLLRIWGDKPVESSTPQTTTQSQSTQSIPASTNNFKTGDKVAVNDAGKWVTGLIVGVIDDNSCLVKWDDNGKTDKVDFKDLTKIQK